MSCAPQMVAPGVTPLDIYGMVVLACTVSLHALMSSNALCGYRRHDTHTDESTGNTHTMYAHMVKIHSPLCAGLRNKTGVLRHEDVTHTRTAFYTRKTQNNSRLGAQCKQQQHHQQRSSKHTHSPERAVLDTPKKDVQWCLLHTAAQRHDGAKSQQTKAQTVLTHVKQ